MEKIINHKIKDNSEGYTDYSELVQILELHAIVVIDIDTTSILSQTVGYWFV